MKSQVQKAAEHDAMDILCSQFVLWNWRDCQLHTSIYDKRDAFNFNITHRSWVVIFHLRWHVAFLFLSLYDTPRFSPLFFILTAGRLSSKLLKTRIPCWTLEIVIQEVLWSILGSYSAIWSLPFTLNGILILVQSQRLSNRSDFSPIPWPWYGAWLSPNYELALSKWTIIKLDVQYIELNLYMYATFQLNVSLHVGEKWGNPCFYQYWQFLNGHNSCKKWRKLMTLKHALKFMK